MVSLLLAREARVDALSSSPLHCAAENGAFGREIIPLLCAAGVNVNAVNKSKRTALKVAAFIAPCWQRYLFRSRLNPNPS